LVFLQISDPTEVMEREVSRNDQAAVATTLFAMFVPNAEAVSGFAKR
jgi:hypothetical protein